VNKTFIFSQSHFFLFMSDEITWLLKPKPNKFVCVCVCVFSAARHICDFFFFY